MYLFAKLLVRLGLLIFCRKIIFSNRKILKQKGPLLLACNHPNSFFDALLLGAFFKHPVHFLARGDAFKNPVARKILTALKAIPIYRLKEGKEYLSLNENTFERCLQILQSGGIVLIFSEGLCINQWDLRPLKKGTARIAIKAWKSATDNELQVLPVSFSYSSFTRFNKRVVINFGEGIKQSDVKLHTTEAEQINDFNKILSERLGEGMIIEKETPQTVPLLINNLTNEKHNIDLIHSLKNFQHSFYYKKLSSIAPVLQGTKKIAVNQPAFFTNLLLSIVLFIPALISMIIHFPLYIPLNNYIKQKTKGTVFYHSALFGALIVIYPLYVILIVSVAAIIFSDALILLLIIVFPVLALLHLQWKENVDAVINYLKLTEEERQQLKQVFE